MNRISVLKSIFLPSILCFVIRPGLGAGSGAFCTSTVTRMENKSDEFVIGYITNTDEKAAASLARKLVEADLVACVNIVPRVLSIYKWEGAIEETAEAMMLVKTAASRREDVIKFVRANHSYTTPEVIFTPIVGGNPDYLKWLADSVMPIESPKKPQ